jgi:hypothetical protein
MPVVFFYKTGKQVVNWKVATVCDPVHDGFVGKIIIVIRILSDVKETILTQSVGLVYLKVQT